MATTTRQTRTRHDVRTVAAPRAIHRRLIMAGMTPTEAGNITAVAVGLQPVPGGWTIREIERVRFLTYLAEHGRIGT